MKNKESEQRLSKKAEIELTGNLSNEFFYKFMDIHTQLSEKYDGLLNCHIIDTAGMIAAMNMVVNILNTFDLESRKHIADNFVETLYEEINYERFR